MYQKGEKKQEMIEKEKTTAGLLYLNLFENSFSKITKESKFKTRERRLYSKMTIELYKAEFVITEIGMIYCDQFLKTRNC